MNIMKQLSRIITSTAIFCVLLSPIKASMDVLEDKPTASKSSYVSRPSLWKTALVGLGMLASPTSTQAQGINGFVGAYVGSAGSDMGDNLYNVSISKISRTHINHYHDYATSEYKSFPMSIYTSVPASTLPGTSASISISKIDICSYPYTFDYMTNTFDYMTNSNIKGTGYYKAELTYNPRGNNYDDIYLRVSAFLPTLTVVPNMTAFEKVWDILMTNGTCP